MESTEDVEGRESQHPPEGPRKEEGYCPVCGVKLSAYNEGPNCWSHRIGWPWRGPSAKPRF